MRRWQDLTPGERRTIVREVGNGRMRKLSPAEFAALSHHEQVVWKAKWDQQREARTVWYIAWLDAANNILFALFMILGTFLIFYALTHS